MSEDYHAAALKSTRETALKTIPKILAEIEHYGNSGRKDARKIQIMYTLNILTVICESCEALRNAAHYDIYVDITTMILLPRLEPKASPLHWKRLLLSLEYLFSCLVEYSVHNDFHRLYSYIIEIQHCWTDEDDAKYLLNIHGYNLQRLAKLQKNDGSIENKLLLTFKALKRFFAQNKEKPRDCTMLLNQFIAKIVTRTTSIQMLLATTWQCKELACMFEAFFELLEANSRYITGEDQCEKFRDNMQALYYFLQMDINSKLKLNTALQFARLLSKFEAFKENEFIKYCSAFLHNILKLTYVPSTLKNFKENYAILCSKFTNFLCHSGKMLMQQLWFQDVVVFVFYLFHSMQMTTSNIFDTFWQQMDNDLRLLYIKLITELVGITPQLTTLKFIEWSCCKNSHSWYHIQLNFTQISLEVYTEMLKNSYIAQSPKEISALLAQSINTLILMDIDCKRSTKSIQKLCICLTNLLKASNRCEHTTDMMSLAVDMTRLKSRISSADWLMIMNRLNKNVLKCKDAKLAAEILSCYIANLICNPAHFDFLTMHQLFYYHHCGNPGTSLFEIYLNLSSPFKTLLQKNERRYYHWFEAQYVNTMYDKEKHCGIYTIMAQRSVSKYDFINAVRTGGLINEPTMFSKVQNIYDVLRNKKMETNALTRWEELVLAHATVLLISKWFETPTSAPMTHSDFREINFPQLLNEKSFTSLSVKKEIKTINMAKDALTSFEIFFNKADEEPLTSYDSNFLDWERILEDITALALYLQMTGYLLYAYEAWKLQYRIANLIDDIHSSLRSLAFFCEYSYLIEKHQSMQLSNEINSKLKVLPHILDNLLQLSRRQQNFTLNCICQIAYYYALQKQTKQSENLLNLVKDLHKNKLQRKECYDIILFTANIVEFRIERMFKDDNILLQKIDAILERLQNYTHVSSADIKLYIILCLNAIDEFAEFSAIRLCDNFLNSFFSSTMKVCVERGYAVRTVKLLNKWALINLQTEYIQRADIKMLFIECILDLKEFKEIATSIKALKSYDMEASKELQTEIGSDMNLIDPEEVRKAACLKTPPTLKMYKPTVTFDFKLENCQYLQENSEECNHVALWCRFTLNCLRARYQFLSFQCTNLHIFYEYCEKWLAKRCHTIHFQINQSAVLTCMMHHGNFLRSNRQYERAIVFLEKCINHCTKSKHRLDPAYLNNFSVQLADTKLEKFEIKNRNLPIKMKSHISNLSIKKTPATKSVINKPTLLSTQKCLDFAIYCDRSNPPPSKPQTRARKKVVFQCSSSENISGIEKENVDACQLIELSDYSDCDKDNTMTELSEDIEQLKIVETTKKKSNKSKELKETEKSEIIEISSSDYAPPKIHAKTKTLEKSASENTSRRPRN